MFDIGSPVIRSIDDLLQFEADCPASGFAALTTYDLIRQKAEAAPDAPALIYIPSGDRDVEPLRWSRSALMDAIHRTANALHVLGVGKTDVVSFLLPNVAEVQPVFWGAQAAGIVNPVNYLLDVEQISRILNLTQCRVLIVAGPDVHEDIWRKALLVRANVPSLRALVVVGGHEEASEGILDFAHICGAVPGDRLVSGREIRADDLATIFHTSGSTGQPKLVSHTHRNEVAAAVATAALFGFGPDDVVNNGMPMFHVAAPMLLSLAPLAAGAQIFMPTAAGMRSPVVLRNFWHFIERFRITVPGGVPTSLLELTNHPLGDADLSSVRFFMTGGAPLSSGLAAAFERHSGKRVCQIYGMTETAGVIAASPPDAALRADQIGFRAPFLEISVRQYEPDGRYEECAAGVNGELCVRGPGVAMLLDPVSAQTVAGDGWLATGDIGAICRDGILSITGRSKDVIIRSGHNIDPAMIEEAVNRHPVVKASVAVGLPDQRAGEVPIVFVVTHDGMTANADEILQFAHAHVAEKPAKPVAIVPIDALPLNAVGKIYRPRLRCDAVELAVAREIENTEMNLHFNCEVEVDVSETGIVECNISLKSKKYNLEKNKTARDVLNLFKGELQKYRINFEVNLLS